MSIPLPAPTSTLAITENLQEFAEAEQPLRRNLQVPIRDVVEVGAWVIDVSAALLRPSSDGARKLEQALDFAATRGAITVTADWPLK